MGQVVSFATNKLEEDLLISKTKTKAHHFDFMDKIFSTLLGFIVNSNNKIIY